MSLFSFASVNTVQLQPSRQRCCSGPAAGFSFASIAKCCLLLLVCRRLVSFSWVGVQITSTLAACFSCELSQPLCFSLPRELSFCRMWVLGSVTQLWSAFLQLRPAASTWPLIGAARRAPTNGPAAIRGGNSFKRWQQTLHRVCSLFAECDSRSSRELLWFLDFCVAASVTVNNPSLVARY